MRGWFLKLFSMAMRRASKVDKNQPEIVEALRKYGAHVELLHQQKDLFDLLVGYEGKLYIMEVKNPAYLPKDYNRERLIKSLEDGEKKCMDAFAKVGIHYYIVTNIKEAINILKDDSSNRRKDI